nr:reverse transcriptase domain-containing protein [Tanacetum cinerariifolium]
MEAQYGKFLDMIRAVRINVPFVDVLAEMPNYSKFIKELVNKKHKIKQILVAFLSDESSAILQNKVSPKLEDPKSFLIPCNFNKAFSCNALADLGASINLISYSLYAKLSLETLKPTKMSIRLADRSFQYPIGIAQNMLVEVGKFTFPAKFVILEMEEDSKVTLILGRPFFHIADAVIRVKQKQLNLGVGTKRMIFHIDYAMKYSYLNDDTCFSIDVIDEILEEDFDALLDEGSEILHSIEGTILKEKLFAEFDEFMAMTESVEVFMDDFSVFGSSFDRCLNNLDKMLQRCKDSHLVLYWEKCHFMVKEGIVIGHMVSEESLEVDKAKIDVISKLLPPTNIKELDIEIKDRKGTKNVATNHLSQIENEETSDDSEVDDNFLGETLMEINTEDGPSFADFANYLASDTIPKGMTYQKKKFFSQTSKTIFGRNPTSSEYNLT